MLKVLAPFIVFGLVVFVHELGHFLAAKWAGVYAPRFSIGFGPALWKRKWGETEYILASLPLGGYVRMASRHDDEGAILEGGSENVAAEKIAQGERPKGWDPDAMIPFGPKPIPEHRWFESKPLWKRLVIMLAGVTMNVILAYLINVGVIAQGGRTIVPSGAVGGIGEVPKMPVIRQLIGVGDTIVAVNGKPVATWNAVQREILTAPGTGLVIRTQRGEVALAAGGPASETRQQIAAAMDFYMPPVVSGVLSGRAAARAGLQAGDSIVAVGGAPVRSFTELTEKVTPAAGKDLRLDLVRAGQPMSITVRPESTEVRHPLTGRPMVAGRIGARPKDVTVHYPVPFGDAVRDGGRATVTQATMIVSVLRGLFNGDVGVKQLGGPIAIVRASVDAGGYGMREVLGLLSLISINVAVLNLLPIPILDGGQVLLNIAESVKGSAFSARTREYVLRAGLLAILLLFVVVMFNDIVALFGDIRRMVGL